MANAAGIVNVGQYGCEANYEGHHHGVCFSCELISADCHLTQSTEMTAWVTQISASRMPANLCRLLLVTVRTIESLGCTVY